MSMAMNPLTGEDSADEFKLPDDCETTETTQTTNVSSCEVLSTVTHETPLTSHKPEPRLCHLKKWPHFQGYGFNLHAERAKTGQHIGKVDADSPAESAGLREGDRIIEVNRVNISNENHQQVVKRIRNGLEKNGKFYDNEVLLLVLDHETDMYYRNLNVIVKEDFKNVLRITTAMPDSEENEHTDDGEDVNNNEPDCVNQNAESKTLTDATNTLMAANSLSSISQKSVNSNHNQQTNNAAVVTSTTSQNENLMNGSVTSMTNKSSNKDAVSSASNLSLSSNNQSNSSKATTPNIQAKNETNNSKMLSNSIVDNITESIYEQNSIDRRAHNNNNNNSSAKKMSNIDPFMLDGLFSMVASSNNTVHRTLSMNSTSSVKPARPPPPKPSRTFSQTSSYTKYQPKKVADPKKLNRYLEMSAAEFKTYLKSKGRVDPRIAQVDMRQKFQMFQDM